MKYVLIVITICFAAFADSSSRLEMGKKLNEASEKMSEMAAREFFVNNFPKDNKSLESFCERAPGTTLPYDCTVLVLRGLKTALEYPDTLQKSLAIEVSIASEMSEPFSDEPGAIRDTLLPMCALKTELFVNELKKLDLKRQTKVFENLNIDYHDRGKPEFLNCLSALKAKKFTSYALLAEKQLTKSQKKKVGAK